VDRAERISRAIDFLKGRKRAYALAFGSPAGQEVLIDLVRFCRAVESCVVPGDRDRSLMLAGRHEVWLRIQQHMKLSSEQLFDLYNARNVLEKKDG
jgi:hypothetical protein